MKKHGFEVVREPDAGGRRRARRRRPQAYGEPRGCPVRSSSPRPSCCSRSSSPLPIGYAAYLSLRKVKVSGLGLGSGARTEVFAGLDNYPAR